MKRYINRIFFLTLICFTALFSACSSDDAPAVPVDPPVDPQPEPVTPSDRDVLAASIKKDAATVAECLDLSAIEISGQTTKQLLALMNRGRYFKSDIMTAITLLTLKNVQEKKNAYGLRVVFDEMGNYNFTPNNSGQLIFIFPAAVADYPKTLYKLTFASNRNWDDVPELFNLTLSGMFNDKELVLNKLVANIEMDSEYPGMAAITLGTFAFNGRVDYCTPDADDSRSNCAMDIKASRGDGGTLIFSLDYEQNGRTVFDTTVGFPLPEDFIINSIGEAIDGADGITASAVVLDDLKTMAKIARGSTFLPALREVIEGVSSKVITPKEFSERVERLNASMRMQIACEKEEAIPMKFLGEKGEEAYCLMPAFRFEGSTDYTSLKQVVDKTTYDNLVEIYKKTALPVSETAAAYSDLLTVMMQILPIPGTKQ